MLSNSFSKEKQYEMKELVSNIQETSSFICDVFNSNRFKGKEITDELQYLQSSRQ